MPPLTCGHCGQETFVFAASVGTRHCSNCDRVLPRPGMRPAQVLDRARQQQFAEGARAAEPRGRKHADLSGPVSGL